MPSRSQPTDELANQHRVSIVLPVYNVAPFLDEALQSIRDQDESALEIICIDDGSTDGSPQILAEHAQQDGRMVVHRQENSGLGAARNAGLSLATGDFVMFADSDDRLPLGAVRVLLASLDRTSSDFAVGKIRRFDETKRWRSALTTLAFNFQVDRTHLAETPQLVYDTVAVNKLYRKTFLDRISFAFPEGVAFEDMALIARAHLAANAIDVVPHWVYEWRERQGSITADRFNPANFADRLQALEQIRVMFAQSGFDAVLSSFLGKLLGLDQMIYARAIDPEDDDQLRAFAQGYGVLYRNWDEDELSTVSSALPQAIARAARSGDLDSLRSLMRLASPDPGVDRFHAAFRRHPRLTLRKATTLAKQRSKAAKRRAGQILKPIKKEAVPVVMNGVGAVLARTTESERTNHLRASMKDPIRDGHNWLTTRSLVRGRRGITIRRGTFDHKGRRIWLGYNGAGWLRVKIRPVEVMVTPLSLDDQWAEVQVEGVNATDQLRLRANRSGRLIAGAAIGAGIWRFPISGIPRGTEKTWRFQHLREGVWKTADGAFDFAPLSVRIGDRELQMLPRVDGLLALASQGRPPLVVASFSDDLCVNVQPDQRLDGIRLRHGGLKTDIIGHQAGDGSWTLDVGRSTRFGQQVPLRTGAWSVQGLVDGTWRRLATSTPNERTWQDLPAGTELNLTFDHTHMKINVRTGYAPDERGKWNQAALSKAVETQMRSAEMRPQVIYECFYGKQVSCHPRAMLDDLLVQYPDWDHLWVINPGMTYAPEGTTPVIRWSRAWYQRMIDSRIVVTNCGLAPHFRRQDRQTVIQTWHGTPLKRIGLDMITFENFRGGYVKETQIQSEQWTHLISPSPFCSEVFPRAFGFHNQLLEIGSPRNDRLVSVDPDEVSAIRANLGLQDGQRAVLIAPTWRDNQRTSTGWHATLGFNPIRLLEALPDDVVVLFRAHSNVRSVDSLVDHPRFINVTDYPDIQDLYLVSDALSTDYSSVMFDFSTLNRPMVFFCPDLDEYRDELRGFYFDFQAEAPGPILTNEHAFAIELARVLTDGLTVDEQQQLDLFRHRYTSLEDGKATQRAVSNIVDAVESAT